jgi:hypothetical protein
MTTDKVLAGAFVNPLDALGGALHDAAEGMRSDFDVPSLCFERHNGAVRFPIGPNDEQQDKEAGGNRRVVGVRRLKEVTENPFQLFESGH